jgi:hypothetical protein
MNDWLYPCTHSTCEKQVRPGVGGGGVAALGSENFPSLTPASRQIGREALQEQRLGGAWGLGMSI